LQHADGEPGHAARDASATDDRHELAGCVDPDAAREEQLDSLRRPGREGAGILEEERALFREEQREAREVGALFVDLDLREVGVVGEVQR
jgi:hypothetical protein